MTGCRNVEISRLARANALITIIASVGRRFFGYRGVPSHMELDTRGRVWFHDSYTKKRIYTHYRYRWRGFTQGGTMKDLVRALVRFVKRGEQLHPSTFGPWPSWVCDGDLWAYGEDMQHVRNAAAALAITNPLDDGRDIGDVG